VVEGDGERSAGLEARLQEAQGFCSRLPLVHRTGRKPGWQEILRTETVAAGHQGRFEEEMGWEGASYWSLGHMAYDKGNMAFVVDRSVLQDVEAAFCPLDTGALHAGHLQTSSGAPAQVQQEWTGAASDLGDFAPRWLAAHLRSPRDYCQPGQIHRPDFPEAHGLSSATGDRRSWTLEVQVRGESRLRGPAVLHLVVQSQAISAHIMAEHPAWVERMISLEGSGPGRLERKVSELITALVTP
jgi:hypothetical protein